MQRKYNLAHFILTSVVALGMTLLMVGIDAHAQIAFVSNRTNDHIIYKIYLMDANGKNLRRLTNNRVDDGSPSWSSDGKRIVFSSNRDGNHEIYVMDNDGGNQQKLTNNPHLDGYPAWFGPAFAVAPTGKKFTIWGGLKQVNR